MQKLFRTMAISSMVFASLTVNEARAASTGAVFFDEADMKKTVTVRGPGLPEGGVKASAWVARSYTALQGAIEDAYRAAGLTLMPITDIGTIRKTWCYTDADVITAATDFKPLEEHARVTGLDVTATIAAQKFMPQHMPIEGLEGLFFDDKDLAQTVTVRGPGLPEGGAKAPAWVARSYTALQGAIEDAYRAAGLTLMPITDIGTIRKTGCYTDADVITAATDLALLAEAARITNLDVSATIAASVFGARI